MERHSRTCRRSAEGGRESSVLNHGTRDGSLSSENVAATFGDCFRTIRKGAVKVGDSKENTDSADETDLHRFVIPAQAGIQLHSTMERRLSLSSEIPPRHTLTPGPSPVPREG